VSQPFLPDRALIAERLSQMACEEHAHPCCDDRVLTIFDSLYLLFAAVPIIYEENRGWNTLVGSLPFLGVLVGTFVAAAVNIAYSHYRFAPLVEKHGRVDPEHRLPPMMIGMFSQPISAPKLYSCLHRCDHVPDWLLPARVDGVSVDQLVPRGARARVHRHVFPPHLPGRHQLPHRRVHAILGERGRGDDVHAIHLRRRPPSGRTAALPQPRDQLGVYAAVSHISISRTRADADGRL
jgi:hypothetical protein